MLAPRSILLLSHPGLRAAKAELIKEVFDTVLNVFRYSLH